MSIVRALSTPRALCYRLAVAALVVAMVATTLVLASLLAPAGSALAMDPPQTFETDPIVAGGVDGPVWASELVGDELWVGGIFNSARNLPFGSPTFATQNLAIININTGLIVERSFDFDGPVYGIEYHDFTVWVIGNFDNVNGQAHRNVVALDAVTGAIKTDFVALSNAQLRDVDYHDGWLYLAGNVSAYNGVSTSKVIRVNPTTGALDTSWAPEVENWVEALDTFGDFIVAGERVDLRGVETKLIRISTGLKVEGLDPLSGEGVWDAKFSPNGNRVYSADTGNAVNNHTINDQLLWVSPEADGDMQSVAATDTRVYAGFHEGFNGNEDRRIVALLPNNGRVDNSWYVEMNSYWGVRDIEIYPQGMVAVGEFTNVNGINNRRVAIFRPIEPWDPAEPLVPPVEFGDGNVNCDADTDSADVVLILLFGIGSRVDGGDCPVADPATQIASANGDANGDGTTDLLDALLIAQCNEGLNNIACPG